MVFLVLIVKRNKKFMEFYELVVVDVIRDTEHSVLISFDVSEDLKEKYCYKAGQYLTIEKSVDGEVIRRCYSLCSAPYEEKLTIAVKAVEDGLVSGSLNSESLRGRSLKVGTPSGRFTLELDPEVRRNHYFIAAGSGITPIAAMIKTILENEPKSNVFLLYGNKKPETTMLNDELTVLKERYENQFYLDHCYSRVKTTMWKNPFASHKNFEGRIGADVLKKWLHKYPMHSLPSQFYVCGPGEMIESCISFFKSQGIESSTIHREYFTVGTQDEEKKKASAFKPTDRAHVHVTLYGEEIDLEIGQEITILEALEEAGYDPPFSCRSGTCASCMAKLKKGNVEMDVCLGLTEEEVEDGYVLTCQSRVASNEIEIDYDDI